MADRSREFALPADHALLRWQPRALQIGIAGLVLSVIGWSMNSEEFYRAYLVSFMFWLGAGLGSLGLLLVQHVSGGRWGAVLRRPLEASARTLPLFLLLFVPVALGTGTLYEWTHADLLAHDAVVQHKAPYLNLPFFFARAAVYFTVWIGLGRLFSAWSQQQDRGHDEARASKVHVAACVGILLYAVTMTFASIDWVMSIDVHWFSHIYGVIWAGGYLLTGFVLMIMVAGSIADRPPFSTVITPDRFHDLGKFTMAFIMLWAYFTLSQYLIIWAGNLPEEVPWYLNRMAGGWQHWGTTLILFHFAVPFIILLSRSIKRTPQQLTKVAFALFVFRYVDAYWLIMPSYHPGDLTFSWINIATTAGIGGLWFWMFVGQLKDHPLFAYNEPILATELPKLPS